METMQKLRRLLGLPYSYGYMKRLKNAEEQLPFTVLKQLSNEMLEKRREARKRKKD